MKESTIGKIKIYHPTKFNKSKNYDKGYGSYICYYNGISYDIFGVYSPKAAIRKFIKYVLKTN